MDLKMIFAVDENWGIGYRGAMLFHLPKELKYFQRTTLGSAVIMGRKTWEALKKPLEGRENLVLSKKHSHLPGAKVFSHVEELMDYVKTLTTEVFVIGGREVVQLLYPWITMAYITKIHQKAKEVDTYLMNLDKDKNFQVVEKSSLVWEKTVSYRHWIYKRIDTQNKNVMD